LVTGLQVLDNGIEAAGRPLAVFLPRATDPHRFFVQIRSLAVGDAALFLALREVQGKRSGLLPVF
jgi:hypothetical protein